MSDASLLFPYITNVIALLAQGVPLAMLLFYVLDRHGS